MYRPEDLKVFYDALPAEQRANLDRTTARIRRFAEVQKASLQHECAVDVSRH